MLTVERMGVRIAARRTRKVFLECTDFGWSDKADTPEASRILDPGLVTKSYKEL